MTFAEASGEAAAAGDTEAGGSSSDGGGAGAGGSWMTAGDVSASAELTAEIKRLMADKKWYNKGVWCQCGGVGRLCSAVQDLLCTLLRTHMLSANVLSAPQSC